MADKKFDLPADLSALSIEDIAELRTLAAAERDEINATEGDLDTAQLDRLDVLMDGIDALDGRKGEIEAEAAALAERQEAARARAGGQDAVEEPAEEVVEEPAAEEVVEEEVVEEPEAVLAAGTKRPTVAAASKKAPAVIIKKEEEPVVPLTTITAAANVPDFEAGEKLDDLTQVAAAFLSRTQSFGSNDKKMKPGVRQLSPNFTRSRVATVTRQSRAAEVSREMSLEEQFRVIMDASKESTLSGGSILAAGGWCAPNETIYDLFSYHTSEGLLDVPEVTARRGGISFTKGPDFMAIYGDTDAGFIQTEAQAEAGTVKPCYAIECPPFEDVRLDAMGYCVTAPLLTDAAYPELVREVLSMLAVGHARRKSATTINRILASIGAATAFIPVGGSGQNSGVADVLGGLELRAMQIRQSLAMSPTATIEGFAPYWARAAFRHELSRRLGLTEPFRISDADVDSWLALRNIRLQYVYDHQMLTTANTSSWAAWPTTLDIPLYPAGAYTRLVNDVVKLDAVYDHDLLTQNTYTAAFMEEGFAIANTRGFGTRTTFQLNYEGASGFPAIGAGEGVTIPTV